jgi:hypothetical protein
MKEMVVIQSTAIRQLHVAAQGLSGTVVQDIYMARPNMTIFEEIEASDGWIRARVGDLPSDLASALLIQIAPAKMPEGTQPIVNVEFSWQSKNSDASSPISNQQTETISATFSSDADQLAHVDTTVQELVDRLKVYKLEREAQKAQSVGDVDKAKEKLGAATRQLRSLGEHSLADDLEAQIANIGQGVDDPSRSKRIKATTRRLGSGGDKSKVPADPPAAAAPVPDL